MTTDRDLDREIAAMPGKIRDAAQQIAKSRRLNEPKEYANANERMAFDAARARADTVFQAAKVPLPDPCAGETLEQFRYRMTTKLLPHTRLRSSDFPKLSAMPGDVMDNLENMVFADAVAQAHLSPELREVTFLDRSGRKVSEFLGQKSSWMNRFKLQPQLGTIFVDDEPRSIPLVL